MATESVHTLYTFDELSERAKEKARDWYREGALYDDWWDDVYEDASQCAKILGINLNTIRVSLIGGGTRLDPCIWFSGFSNQGDGACFEGSYTYAKGGAKAIRGYAGVDTVLHAIADELQALQRRHFYRLEAHTANRGHYCHSGCMTVDVSNSETGNDVDADTESALTDILRSFADWIYRQLEATHDYIMSDESVDESIRCNEHTFDEDGNRDD